MKERPILFSGPMVRSLLAGTKTQTRRVAVLRGADGRQDDHGCWRFCDVDSKGGEFVWQHSTDIKRIITEGCPYGFAGDRLWVRETWCSAYARGAWGTIFAADDAFVQGKRQHEKGPHFNACDRPPLTWRPSIFMPHWASRLTLEVTEVRVQRVQDISEEDAQAEGVEPVMHTEMWLCVTDDGRSFEMFVEPDGATRKDDRIEFVKHRPASVLMSARDAYRRLWGDINGWEGPKSWDANPFVWCVSFKRLDTDGGAS